MKAINAVVNVLGVFLSLCVFPSLQIPCNLEFGVDIDDGEILPNGDIVKDNVTYKPDNVRQINGVKIGCICNIVVCVRKCCPSGEYMTNRTCVPTETPFIIPKTIRPSEKPYHFVYGNKCKSKKTRTLLDPVNIEEQQFVLQDDSRLVILHSNTPFRLKEYCVDYIEDQNDTKALVCAYDSDIQTTNQIDRCLDHCGCKSGCDRMRCTCRRGGVSCTLQCIVCKGTVVIKGMIVSMPFLLATFLVYAILPDRNLHGKSLMCYVISLFGAYLLLVIVQLYPTDFEIPQCKILAIICLFLFMVSFFWMNVMSIDIWWTFSGLRGFSGTRKETEQKRFLLYSGYAWGVPLLLVIIVTYLTLSPTIPLDVWYNPGIADGQCWFREEISAMVFFYGPIAVLTIINVILFCSTAWNIRKVKQETAMLKKNDSRKHKYENDKQRFNLYLKLMLAMGINWSMDIISWIINWQVAYVPRPIWYLTDFCNAVYGIFIFFMFVFKRSIWNLLKKRYYMLMGKPHLARLVVQPQRSQTSQANSSVNQKIPIVHFTNNNVLTTSEGA